MSEAASEKHDQEKQHSESKSTERARGGGTSSNDANAVRSRVFIGHLPTEKIEPVDLQNLFEKYGRVYGASLHKGFGFVQFGCENDALDAARGENGKEFMGNILNVNLAIEGRRDPSDKRDRSRDRSPVRRPAPAPYHPAPYPPARPPPPNGYYPPPAPYPPPEDPYHRRPPPHYPPPPPHYRPPPPDPYYRPPPAPAEPPIRPAPISPAPPATPKRPPFDCVVIGLENRLTNYCEMVEQRLRHIGLYCDVRITDDSEGIPKLIDDLSHKGILFTVTAGGKNEQHKSLTVNILFGTPQEHRNMPLEDAMKLIQRSFEDHMRETGGQARPLPSAKSGIYPPDQHVQYLLDLLADSRYLRLRELDDIIAYVQERRSRQLKTENPGRAGEEEPRPEASGRIIEQQAELQAKILNILQGGSNPPAPHQQHQAPAPAAIGGREQQSSSNQSGLFPSASKMAKAAASDPSIQKAIDSLMGGSGQDALRSVNS